MASTTKRASGCRPFFTRFCCIMLGISRLAFLAF